jgi:outer membrane immunogenic protein
LPASVWGIVLRLSIQSGDCMTVRKTFIALAASALGIGGAAAADLNAGYKDLGPAAPVGWTGAYVGVIGGLDLLSAGYTDGAIPVCAAVKNCGAEREFGGLAGGTAGINWQNRNFVLGAEADIAWTDIRATSEGLAPHFYMQSQIDAIATARLRSGYASSANLFYLTAGAAFVETRHQAHVYAGCSVIPSACDSSWRTGFAAGAGYEAMITGNLSVKAEYLYIGMTTDKVQSGEGGVYAYGFQDDLQIARVGLNYKFGGGSTYQPMK